MAQHIYSVVYAPKQIREASYHEQAITLQNRNHHEQSLADSH